MDSINRNQPEENHKDLTSAEAVAEIKVIVKRSPSCFFCTAIGTGESGGVRPMSVQRVDDDGMIWFLSAVDSHKNEELTRDPRVRLYFQGSSHSDFLYLDGKADASQNKAMIKELWEPICKVWFTGGVDDPRISVIRFVPSHGYYWDNKHGNAVAGVKMLIGAALGKTLDDSIEGRLSV